MMTARRSSKWGAFKDLIKERKWISEMESMEGSVVEEGIRKGVTASGPSTVVTSMLSFG